MSSLPHQFFHLNLVERGFQHFMCTRMLEVVCFLAHYCVLTPTSHVYFVVNRARQIKRADSKENEVRALSVQFLSVSCVVLPARAAASLKERSGEQEFCSILPNDFDRKRNTGLVSCTHAHIVYRCICCGWSDDAPNVPSCSPGPSFFLVTVTSVDSDEIDVGSSLCYM